MAIEIVENNFNQKEIILAGINNNGLNFAKRLASALKKIKGTKVITTNVRLNPADPLKSSIDLKMEKDGLANKVIIIVDDVANTGRTIFYATKPFMDILPQKIEIAVLVDRKHKMFPIKVDYVGISLATTLKENIEVSLVEKGQEGVHLR